jgi:hypothetical protein
MFADRALLETYALLKAQAAGTKLDAPTVLWALLAVAVTALVVDYARMLHLRSRMPPGPFPLPIVGNTLSLPKKKPWILFEEISKKLNSPVITFWIGRYVFYPHFHSAIR